MTLKPEIIDAMVAAGCTAEQIAAVVKASLPARSSNAERQARYRERQRNACNVTERNGNASDVTIPSPKRKVSPCTPSKENNPIPASSEPTGSSEAPARDDEQAAFDAWNETAHRSGLPIAEKLTKDRRSKLKARLIDAGGLDGWGRAMIRLEASDFCAGRKTDFRANLDFVLQPRSFTKLIEGSYDNNPNQRGQHDQRSPHPGKPSLRDQIREGIRRSNADRGIREPVGPDGQGDRPEWAADGNAGGVAPRTISLGRGEDGTYADREEHPRRYAGARH